MAVIQLPQARIQPQQANAPIIPGQNPLQPLAQGLAGAANAASEIQSAQDALARKHEQINADREHAAAVLTAETALNDGIRDFQTQLDTRRGAAAKGATEEAQKWVAENLQKIGENMTERSRLAFEQRAAPRRDALLDSVASYESKQMDADASTSAGAKILSAQSFAAANAGNPAAVEVSRKDIIEAVGVQARLLGLSEAAAGVERLKALSGMHAENVRALALQNPSTAQAYFEKHKAEILGTAQAPLQKYLQETGVRVTGQQFFDSLNAQNLSFDEQEAAIVKNLTGDTRDYAIGLVDRARQKAAVAESKAASDALNKAVNIFDETQDINAIPAEVWAGLDDRGKITLRSLDRQRASDARAAVDYQNATQDRLDRLQDEIRAEAAAEVKANQKVKDDLAKEHAAANGGRTDKIPKEVWAAASPDTKLALIKDDRAADSAERAAVAAEVAAANAIRNEQKRARDEQAADVFNRAYEMATLHPAAFRDMDLTQYRSVLGANGNDSRYRILLDRQEELKNGGDLRTLAQQLDTATLTMKPLEKQEFRTAVELLLKEVKGANGRVTEDDRTKAIADVQKKITWGSGAWSTRNAVQTGLLGVAGNAALNYITAGGKTATVAQILANPELHKQFISEFTVEDIPEAERTALRDGLQARNLGHTDADVLRMYMIRYLGLGGSR